MIKHYEEPSDIICFKGLLFPSVTFACPLGQLWLCHRRLTHSLKGTIPSPLLLKKECILMRGTFALHVENRTQQALMKSVMKKDADIHTLIVTDPKPRPRRGSWQFRTGQALTSQLHAASQPALQNTPSTCRFQRATGKARAGSVRGTEASQDTASPLTINSSSLWTLCRSPANLQVQNVKISQLCKMKKSRFFVFLSIWLFQRLTSKLSSTGRRTRVLLCKVRGNADKLFSSRSWRFKKNSRYRETPNSHKTLML